MSKKKIILLLGIGVFVGVIVLLMVMHMKNLILYLFSISVHDAGAFGDCVGGIIGALTGLIGIFFLYGTYRMQIQISQEQGSLQSRQQFESAFFMLLTQQRNIVNSLEGKFVGYMKGEDKKFSGYQYLSALKRDLSLRLQELNYEPKLIAEERKNLLKLEVNVIYRDFFVGHVSQLGHYFRNLYHILKYINESDLPDKKKYSDLMQAQMSSDELFLIAINGISNYGRRRMLPLLDRYSFLENLVIDDNRVLSELIKIFYPNTKRKTVDDMERNIVFVGGVHGAGKSHFLEVTKRSYSEIEILSCSKVLGWVDPTEKVVNNIADNQDILVGNLRKMVDVDKPYLLDGHFCLLNKDGEIEDVPLNTFQSINPQFIILIVEDVDIILDRLSTRDKRRYDSNTIKKLCDRERFAAYDVSERLGVPIYEIKSFGLNEIKYEIEKFIEKFK